VKENMKLNANLGYKLKYMNAYSCEIGKVIELSAEKFDAFKENLLAEHDFIAENNELLRSKTKDNQTVCLLVLGEGLDDGILVDPEGCNYARCTAFISNARQLVFLEQRYRCIEDLESFAIKAVEEIVSDAYAYKGEGNYCVLISDVLKEYCLKEHDTPLLVEMLNERSGITSEITGDEIAICYNRQIKEETARHRPSVEEVEIMKARHILWCHNQKGGKQADFTNMDLTECYLTNAMLEDAIFKDTVLNAATITNGNFHSSDFTNAVLHNVDGTDAVFEGCNFTNAKLINCHFLNAGFMECNFTNTDLTGSDFNMAWMDESDFTGANIESAKLDNARMDNCIGLQIESVEDESLGIIMK